MDGGYGDYGISDGPTYRVHRLDEYGDRSERRLKKGQDPGGFRLSVTIIGRIPGVVIRVYILSL